MGASNQQGPREILAYATSGTPAQISKSLKLIFVANWASLMAAIMVPSLTPPLTGGRPHPVSILEHLGFAFCFAGFVTGVMILRQVFGRAFFNRITLRCYAILIVALSALLAAGGVWRIYDTI